MKAGETTLLTTCGLPGVPTCTLVVGGVCISVASVTNVHLGRSSISRECVRMRARTVRY
jgi:hypothetical protein